jgi:hypothetical protein
MPRVDMKMTGLFKEEVSLDSTYSNENPRKDRQPKGIDSQLPLSFLLLISLGGIGLLSAYLYDHGRRFLAVLIAAISLALWACRASVLIFGTPFVWLTGHTDCKDCGNCEYRQTFQHDGKTLAHPKIENNFDCADLRLKSSSEVLM